MTRLKHREPACLERKDSATDDAVTDVTTDDSATNDSSTASAKVVQLEGTQLAETPVVPREISVVPKVKTRQPNAQLSPAHPLNPQLAEAPAKAATNPKTRYWYKIARAIVRYPNIFQALLFLTLLSGTGVALGYLLFRGAWQEHTNNPALLGTILKMELNREDTRGLKEYPDHVVTRTFKTLDSHVEKDGWVWINRFGSTVTYGKQEQRMIASCRPYSPLYIICNLSKIPQFDEIPQ